MKQYYYWIDTVRAICMVLVYYVHCSDFSSIHYSFDHGLISSIYVNAFFIVSGYLLFKKQLSNPIITEDCQNFLKNGWKNGISNIIYRIALPTIFFSAIFYIPKELLAKESLDLKGFLVQTIGGGTYWFTSALFVAELLLFFLLISRKKSIWFYFVICIFLSAISMLLCGEYDSLNQSRQPWSYMSGLLSVGLLTFGGLYRKYEGAFNKLFSRRVLLLVLLLIVCIPVYVYPDYFNYSLSKHTVNVLGYIWCVPLSFILFAICKLIPRIGILNFWGKNSLCLYLLSGVSPRISTILVQRLNMNDFMSLLLIILLALIISSVVIIVLNKYFSFIFDFRKICIKK